MRKASFTLPRSYTCTERPSRYHVHTRAHSFLPVTTFIHVHIAFFPLPRSYTCTERPSCYHVHTRAHSFLALITFIHVHRASFPLPRSYTYTYRPSRYHVHTRAQTPHTRTRTPDNIQITQEHTREHRCTSTPGNILITHKYAMYLQINFYVLYCSSYTTECTLSQHQLFIPINGDLVYQDIYKQVTPTEVTCINFTYEYKHFV